jgi:hypothetical protein
MLVRGQHSNSHWLRAEKLQTVQTVFNIIIRTAVNRAVIDFGKCFILLGILPMQRVKHAQAFTSLIA